MMVSLLSSDGMIQP